MSLRLLQSSIRWIASQVTLAANRSWRPRTIRAGGRPVGSTVR